MGAEVRALAFQRGDPTLATITVGTEKHLALWPLRPGDAVAELEPAYDVSAVYLDGATLGVLGPDTATCCELPAGPDAFREPSLVPRACWLAAAGADRSVRLWAVAPDALIAQACARLPKPCP